MIPLKLGRLHESRLSPMVVYKDPLPSFSSTKCYMLLQTYLLTISNSLIRVIFGLPQLLLTSPVSPIPGSSSKHRLTCLHRCRWFSFIVLSMATTLTLIQISSFHKSFNASLLSYRLLFQAPFDTSFRIPPDIPLTLLVEWLLLPSP